MCVFHIPSEGQQSALSVIFEPTSFENECNQVHDQSTSSSESPIPNQTFVWGWNGNLSFEYWNDTLDIGIENATVQYWWAYSTGFAIETGNGTYAIPIDTRQVYPGDPYPLTIFATKPGQEPLNELVYIVVLDVPTEILVLTPIQNQIGGPLDLVVPFGDLLNIILFYNDTDSSDGYVGGIPDAVSICRIWGPTLPTSDYSVTELGNGNYSIIIDSLNSSLYTTTGGEPVLSHEPYVLNVVLHSQNRSAYEITLRIRIVEIPTYVAYYNDSFIVNEGYIFNLELHYTDAWHDIPITGASVSVNSSDSDVLQIVETPTESYSNPGQYIVTLIGAGLGTAVISVIIDKSYYQTHEMMFFVRVEPMELDPLPPPPPPPGLSVAIFIVIAVIVYSRRNSNAASESDTSAQ